MRPMPDRRPLDLTRRAALTAVLLPLSACSLRLEDDAPLPGPKATAAADTSHLLEVRKSLVAAMHAAERETTFPTQARAAQTLHRSQLARLDATLAGLGAKNLPRVTATGDPVSPTPTRTRAASPTQTPPIPPSAGATATSTASTAPATAWIKSERAWAAERSLITLSQVDERSRPLAFAVAAAGLATVWPAKAEATWSSDIAMPSTRPQLTAAVAEVVEALEWLAAKTPVDEREAATRRLTWAYAARSFAQAGAATAQLSTPPVRRYTSPAKAQGIAANALRAVQAECVRSASAATTPQRAGGVLFTWSGAAAVAAELGVALGPFPGLAA